MIIKGGYKLRRSPEDIETHEVFLDKLAKFKEEELGLSEKKLEIRIREKIIYFIFGVFVLFAVILFGKTFYWQVAQGSQLYTLSQNNKGKVSLVRPERGIIYDKNLKKLVVNSPAYDLVCDKRNFSNTEPKFFEEISKLSEILGKDSIEIESIFSNSEESKVLVSENLDHDKILVVEARALDIPDCSIEKNTVRDYKGGVAFSHLLGYTGRVVKDDLENTDSYSANDYIGKVGLEKSYETDLRGTPGRVEVVKNALGVKQEEKTISEASSGYNLVLNVDSDLQNEVYKALEKSIKNIGAKKGAAVALDPRTGAVLALVSYPSYDDNIFSQGISQKDYDALMKDPNQPFFNRAIAAQYPTGSTIKPFLASAALQENIISPDKLIDDKGFITIKNQYDPSIVYKFAGVVPHGLVDMRKAIAVSSNIYFYTVGGGYEDQKGLGPTRIKKYLDLFGWEQKTGIDLPGEFKGFVPSSDWKKQYKGESWWDGDTYNLSIGQSDLQVTPLQVALAYSVIANGGTMYKPQIVSKVVESTNGKSIVEEFKPEVIVENFIDKANLEIVREGMRDGVEKSYGSSFMLNDLPVEVAGKTGTAETNKDGIFNTWSSNFAPYDNPEIVFVATIEGVQGLRAATLPVAHDVLNWYFSNKK